MRWSCFAKGCLNSLRPTKRPTPKEKPSQNSLRGFFVRMKRFELSHPRALPPESSASTNFATSASLNRFANKAKLQLRNQAAFQENRIFPNGFRDRSECQLLPKIGIFYSGIFCDENRIFSFLSLLFVIFPGSEGRFSKQ